MAEEREVLEEFLMVRTRSEEGLAVVEEGEAAAEEKRVVEEGGGATQWRLRVWVAFMSGPFESLLKCSIVESV